MARAQKAILKYTEWESVSGWHCNDVSDLAGLAGMWWVPARMLGMAPVDYIQWLVDKYSPDQISFDGKTLLYSWKPENYHKMHAFVLYINKYARDHKFFI